MVAPEVRAAARREHVLAVAAEVFSEKGYRATSMHDLAHAADMRKPTIYHYFASKEELLIRLYETVMDSSVQSAQLISSSDLAPLDILRELVVHRIVYTCEHRDLLRIFFEEEAELPREHAQRLVERRREYEEIFVRVVKDALAAGARPLPTSPKLYVYSLLGASNWVYKWYDQAGPKTPVEIANEMADVLLSPLVGQNA